MALTRSSVTPAQAAPARPRVSPPRRRPSRIVEAAADTDAPRCLVCLTEAGVLRSACGHPVCADCLSTYLAHRIGERAVLEIPCPAADAAHPCQPLSRAEVSAAVTPEMYAKYEHFVVLERAEKDPSTRWCVKAECGAVCGAMHTHPPLGFAPVAAALALCGAAAAAPVYSPDVAHAVGLHPALASLTAAIGALGLCLALYHVSRRLGPHRRCLCPRCGDAVCFDCKAAWHPGRMCEELSAQSVLRARPRGPEPQRARQRAPARPAAHSPPRRLPCPVCAGWCRSHDSGQCPQCGVFIERRAGCNHMDCRCGHHFCWLCLEPLLERCGCPQFGGRRTQEARARLSDSGWRRSGLLSGDIATSRSLGRFLLVGALLQLAPRLVGAAREAGAAAYAAPYAAQLMLLQLALGIVHLVMSRAAMYGLPRRIYLHLVVRQLDLSFGGAGTNAILSVLRLLGKRSLAPALGAAIFSHGFVNIFALALGAGHAATGKLHLGGLAALWLGLYATYSALVLSPYALRPLLYI